MKKLFLLAFLATSIFISNAANISGKVVSGKTRQPIEFVNVVLFQSGDKTPLRKAVTNAVGEFSLPMEKNGKYVLKFNFVGYKNLKKEIVWDGKTINLGTVSLDEKNQQLSEVEVLGQGSQMRFDIDKKVFSVDKNIASSGGSVTDVLKNIPSVDVDVEGNVSLRNDNNVEILIDGKSAGLSSENRAQILEQMPAEDVKSIEIISNPSSKYSASGTGGIINLVMKENKKPGYYGGVMTGISRAGRGKTGGLLGANISYTNKKIDFYANMGYRDVVKQGNTWTNRYRYNDGDTTKLRKDNTRLHENKSPFFRAGLNYKLDDKNTIGMSGFGLLTNESYDNSISYLKTSLPDNSYLKKYSRENKLDGDHPSVHLSMDYQHKFKEKGSLLKASITFTRHKTGGDYQFIQQDSIPYLSTSDINQHVNNVATHWNMKMDYTRQFTKDSKLEAGWHSKFIKNLNQSFGIDNVTSDTIASLYNRFDFEQQIHAGYLTYANRIKNLSFLAGMRGEYISYLSTNHTATYTQHNSRQSYFQLFPSMFLSYSLPNRNELQLNYTRRINRPSASQLNPFKDYSDVNDVEYGNATLSPEYSSSMELNYIKSWDNHMLSASAYYKNIRNDINDIRFVSPSNSDIMENTYINMSKAQKAGFELIGKNRLFRILDLTTAFNVYYNQVDSAVYQDEDNDIYTIIPAQSNVSWTGKMIANLMMSKSFSAQVIGEYASSKIIPQGKKSPNYSIDLGIRKTFLDRNLVLNLVVRDVFDTDKKKTTTWGTGFDEISQSTPHGRTLRFTVSYNFGNMKSKKRNELQKKQNEQIPEMDTDGEDGED